MFTEVVDHVQLAVVVGVEADAELRRPQLLRYICRKTLRERVAKGSKVEERCERLRLCKRDVRVRRRIGKAGELTLEADCDVQVKFHLLLQHDTRLAAHPQKEVGDLDKSLKMEKLETVIERSKTVLFGPGLISVHLMEFP